MTATALASLVLAAACDRKAAPAPEPAVAVAPLDARPAVAPLDARPAAPPDAAPPVAACTPAMFAAYGACGSSGGCIQLYEVDAACVVQPRRALSFTDAAEDIFDVAWPRRDDDMYIVITTDVASHTAWGVLGAPVAASDKMVAAITWHTEKLGAGDARGAQLGLDTDGSDVAIAACTQWVDDNEEEWHCEAEDFKSLTSKRDPEQALVPPFTRRFAPGGVVPGVTLRKTRRGLECRSGTGKFARLRHPVPLATAAIDVTGAPDDAWALVEHAKGSRATPVPTSEIVVMKGCDEDPKLRGDVELGPAGYWAHRPNRYTTGDDTLWRIHRRGSPEPLLGADGKPARIEGNGLTFTQP